MHDQDPNHDRDTNGQVTGLVISKPSTEEAPQLAEGVPSFEPRTIEWLEGCLNAATEAADNLAGQSGIERLKAQAHSRRAGELNELAYNARQAALQWEYLLGIARAHRASGPMTVQAILDAAMPQTGDRLAGPDTGVPGCTDDDACGPTGTAVLPAVDQPDGQPGMPPKDDHTQAGHA